MKYLTAKEIRDTWLNFFKEKGHHIEESAPLVPMNDATLLWINAGVAPLKKYFDGSEKPNNPRITNIQKCVRTNDIENVGLTARHHTFFEMLGNFSIGDYFKQEAIEFGFELLTKRFEMPLDKLYITHYTDDLEARNKWISLGVSPDHLIPLEGNFWEIGEGPCGPDTEIFFDRGEAYDKRGKELIEQDIENDRFIEIWNIVFSQYNSKEGLDRKDYPELPSKNIDTGSGLERMCCVMQGTKTNYETDLFMPYMKKIEEISGIKYDGQMSFKVIADHIRTLTFAISDGAILSNEGRGYVLRRILRRACKHAKKLGINRPFLYEIVDVVVDVMKSFYPYIEGKKEIVKKIIKQEEEKFLETLNGGEKRISDIISTGVKEISGSDAFMLYDTYGFPIELTIEYAQDNGITVDTEGFKKCMMIQKENSRNARENVESMKSQNEEYLNFTTPSTFVGYTDLDINAKVIKVFKEGIVLDKTPFYATMGGQVADLGTINGIEVKDVAKLPNGQHIHILDTTNFREGDTVNAKVDVLNRDAIRRNHSSAHLTQRALKDVLGEHVHQQGSQVTSDYMRFDFNNYSNLTDEEILKVEKIVKEKINEGLEIKTLELPIAEAKKLGAEALFGEKYGEVVRVVDMDYSKEFCGGTHAKNTKDIIDYAITSVESIGSGIFRVSAVTGNNVYNLVLNHLKNLENEFNTLKDKALKIVEAAKNEGIDLTFDYKLNLTKDASYKLVLDYRKALEELKNLTKELEKEYNRKKAQQALSNLSSYDKYIEGNTLVTKVENVNMDSLKQLADALLNKMGNGIVFMASIIDNKLLFVCKNNIGKNAGELVKKAAMATGGNGGGRPDMATAGGKDINKVDEALSLVKDAIKG
ncbi:MAG: alanine--tRNA ligase [Acholeplasmatales bacterium]|nr:alanine--tRNA ligase [Acholeplasmatales bacterium]